MDIQPIRGKRIEVRPLLCIKAKNGKLKSIGTKQKAKKWE